MHDFLTPEERKNNSHFIQLCENNDVEGVELVLNKRKMFARDYLDYNHAFLSACENNSVDVINLLLEKLKKTLNYEVIFRDLISSSNLGMLVYLKNVEPKSQEFWNSSL